MKRLFFYPREALFSVTARCNMRCAHCDVKKGRATLDRKAAIKFVDACARNGIKRVGFTGGEPFLAPGLICAISKEVVKHNMLFSRIHSKNKPSSISGLSLDAARDGSQGMVSEVEPKTEVLA